MLFLICWKSHPQAPPRRASLRVAPVRPDLTSTSPLGLHRDLQVQCSHRLLTSTWTVRNTARPVFTFSLFFFCSCSPEWWPEEHQPRRQSEELAAPQPEASLTRQRNAALPTQQHQPAEGARRQPAAAQPGLSESPRSRSRGVRNWHKHSTAQYVEQTESHTHLQVTWGQRTLLLPYKHESY